MSADKSFETWAVIEVMGHKRLAGFVTEQTVAGAAFVRVDVPAVLNADTTVELPAFTKLLGAGSIYAITPCTEETARAFVCKMRERAFANYEAPRLIALPKTVGDIIRGAPTNEFEISEHEDTVANYLDRDDKDDEVPI